MSKSMKKRMRKKWKRWQKIKFTHELLAFSVAIVGTVLIAMVFSEGFSLITIGGMGLFLIGISDFLKIRNNLDYKIKYPEKEKTR